MFIDTGLLILFPRYLFWWLFLERNMIQADHGCNSKWCELLSHLPTNDQVTFMGSPGI
jgi:hypothetical protein